MARVRVQNRLGLWLRADRTWSKHRSQARVFRSIDEAELELERVMLAWLGQVIFDVTADG
jgi:hypothetical protein